MFWQDIEIKSESEGGVKGVGVTGMSTVLACKRLTGSNLQSETHFLAYYDCLKTNGVMFWQDLPLDKFRQNEIIKGFV